MECFLLKAANSIHVVNSPCLLFYILSLDVRTCTANDYAKKLYDDLLRKKGYNRIVRPVLNATDKIKVKIGLNAKRDKK